MHPVSPTHSQVAEHSFDRIVMHLDTTILQEHLEGLLVIKYIVDCSLSHCTIRRIKLDLLQQLHQLANDRCIVLKSILLNCLIQDCSVCSKHPYTRVLEDGVFLHTVTTATLLIFHHTKLGFSMERAAWMYSTLYLNKS